MWLEIILSIYVLLAICTYIYIMTDEEVTLKGVYVAVFAAISLFWPIVWLVYLVADDR